MAKYPSDSQDKFVLRLPNGMRDRIKAAADENGRSMNSEIVATLLERYPEDTDANAAFLRAVSSHMQKHSISSAELAATVGMERLTFDRFMAGIRKPSLSEAITIMDVLGIDPGEVFRSRGTRPDPAE